MIPLAIGLGLLGFFAMRRAHRFCHAHGYGPGAGYGWYGPWGPTGHHMRHGRRGRRRWMLHALLRRVDALPGQERAIAEELDKLESRVVDAKGHMRDAGADLSAVLRSSSLDDAALGAVMGRVDAATSDVRSAAVDALRAIHGILDDKQRADLADLLDRQGRGDWFRGGPYR
jgi:hypothetical protein